MTTNDSPTGAEGVDPLDGLDFEPSQEAFDVDATPAAQVELTELEKAQAASAEHLGDLQRLNAEYANFSKRAKREQELARNRGIEDLLVGLLPVLDDVSRARQAGDLTGPFEAIADKFTATLTRFGVESYGEAGEEFNPAVHEALMHQTSPDATTTTVTAVIETGYRIGDRIVRAARVAVVGPEA
ncbi:molecular chaperone GrpE [Sanguibacter gelidistatuariae]|uniref:Protein GrpE n=1 Tax=Sanguibacter gelidistatuariae TaxID=1814289 RepID=A0A1G6GPX0_9MICO|nr:nucleotide exchange factor GrpE [Sanguibacter gelidistatuariae]SDB83805.1 molecular chaperone GrpE [Sanguibacter gelidistatuariae]